MALDDAVHSGQTHARTFEILRTVLAREGSEQLVGVLHVESRAVVTHEEHEVIFLPLAPELDPWGGFSFRIESSLDILGRQLLIHPAEGPLLALIYGATALWFFGA